jgi:hypothetical protein
VDGTGDLAGGWDIWMAVSAGDEEGGVLPFAVSMASLHSGGELLVDVIPDRR